MNRREASKHETRQLILNAARNQFKEKEFSECTMRSIAKEAGVSPASVVVHFKNKTALMEMALFEDIERVVGGAIDSMPPDADLLESMTHIYRIMFNFYDKKRELYRVLIRSVVFGLAGESPHLNRQTESFLEFTGGLIERRKKEGIIHAHVDSRIAANSLFGMYFFVVIDFLRTPERSVADAEKALSDMMGQFFSGIQINKEST